MVMKMRLKMKNRPQRYDMNKPRHSPKYTKFKVCLSITMVQIMKRLVPIMYKLKL